MTIRFVHSFPKDCPLELKGPVVSIYFKTHRTSTNAKIDQKTFKNLIKEAKNQLEAITDKRTTEKILEPLEALLIEPSFWIYNQEACAIFANVDDAVVYRLFEPVDEKVIVSSSVYIKPLIRVNQLKHHYFILGLTRDRFEVFEVFNEKINIFKFDSSVFKTSDEVVGTEKSEPYLGTSNFNPITGRGTWHGHGGQKKESAIDAERFFRYVDKTVTENITNIQSLPLILCALPKNQVDYRQVAKDVNLLSNHIQTTYEALSLDELKARGDEIISEYKQSIFNTIQKQARLAIDSQRYSDQIDDIIKAISDKKIDRLLIMEGKNLKGEIDWNDNKYIEVENNNDVYDDCAEACIKIGVPVYILPESSMPTTTEIFAIINP